MSRIALDVESVLADTNEAALRSSDSLDREHLLGEWNLSDHQWQVYIGVTDAIWRHNPQFIPPEEPALDQYVSDLNKRHQVDIVTGREHVDQQVKWWLDEHGIEYENFVSTGCAKYKFTEYDVFVDDNPEMFGECRLLLRHQPWNDSLDDKNSKSCDRIYSLAEVRDFL